MNRLTNEGLEQKKKEAEEAARRGDVAAQWVYGRYLLMPNCTYEQYQEGLSFLKLAASQGHCLAQTDLAYFEFYGKGCEKNVDDALLQCERAITTIQEIIHIQDGKAPDQEPNFWSIRLQRAVILRDTINKLKTVSNHVSDAQKALLHSFEKHDLSEFENLLDEKATLSFMIRPTYVGKEEVVKWFKEQILSKEYRVAIMPTLRFGMAVEIYIPNEMRNIVRSLFFTRTNNEGRIDRVAHQAYDGGEFCFIPGGEPFQWEEIEPCLENVDTTRHSGSVLVRGRMFCMSCGKLSNELKWIHFHSNPTLHNGFTYTGIMSVCVDCQQQVEFFLDKCEMDAPLINENE